MQTRRTRSKTSIAFLCSVLQPLVDSGYVCAAEVGTLAQVSNELNQATLEDSIWASFCQREYASTKIIFKSIKEFKGHRWLYKSFSAPVVKRRPPAPALEQPACLPSQVFLCVNMKYDGIPIISTMFNLGTLRVFLEQGRVRIKFRQPIILGKAEWSYTEVQKRLYESGRQTQQGLPVKCRGFDSSKVNWRVHLFRTSGLAMCCLFRSGENERRGNVDVLVHPEVDENITSQTKFDLSRDQKNGLLSFRKPKNANIESWPLQHTRQAEVILDKFPYPLFLESSFEFGVVEGDKFAITSIVLVVMTKDSNTPRRFHGNQEPHGVTLLHVLSELQGTHS